MPSFSREEAALWSAVWVGLALGFGALIWRLGGERMALEYYTGWLIEKSLSVDNLFVFLLIFSWFRVPPALQHRVLFWGILGALVLRGLMIAGGLLLLTAVRMVSDGSPERPRGWALVAAVRRVIPISEHYAGARFFIRADRADGRARFMATPLLLVLITVEVSDLVFAVDSIPAVFAYPALSLVLFFVGTKMLLSGLVDVPLPLSLGFIAAVLMCAIVLSVLRPAPRARSPFARGSQGARRT